VQWPLRFDPLKNLVRPAGTFLCATDDFGSVGFGVQTSTISKVTETFAATCGTDFFLAFSPERQDPEIPIFRRKSVTSMSFSLCPRS
jgi:hypothetical protein